MFGVGTTKERAQAGAEFLDEQDPGWWETGEDGIDLSTLNLDDNEHCVWGQLYGDYCTAATRFCGPDADLKAEYLVSLGVLPMNELDAGALTRAWSGLITERREAVRA